MSLSFELNAEVRSGKGTGASRRLRREKKVPGVIYGAGKDPVYLAMNQNVLLANLEHEPFYSHILSVKYDGQEEKAVLKDLHRHPFKPEIMHFDLQRVSEKTRIRMSVPLHFIGEDKAPGVKKTGGIVNHMMTNVDIICLARDLPEYLEVDLSTLEADHSIHLSDIPLPKGVELLALQQGADHDLPVAAIVIPRGMKEEEEAPAAAEGEKAEGAGE